VLERKTAPAHVLTSTTEDTEITGRFPRFVLGPLLRNTKFNAEAAQPAEKNPLKLCDLCVLCVQPL